jgi:ribulose 1,5-bisphosphate synthetase/thiazole synthase
MHSLVLHFLFGAVAFADATARTTYDYIIVGGGTTGLVVANRLSENLKSTS